MPNASKPPVRGTQSFVGVMSQVWSRPSLTALEIAWRWLAGLLACFVAAPIILGSLGMDVRLAGSASPVPLPRFAALQGITLFQPVIAVQTVQAMLVPFFTSSSVFLYWSLPAAFLLWNLIAAFGRTFVLRRFDSTLHARRLTLFVLGSLRALLLTAAWLLWFWGLACAARTAITAPAARGEEPSVVLFAAMLITGTLVLYVAWGVFSWFLQLAPLLAVRDNLGPFAALRAALASGKDLRGKLIEINLVMNIVRLCLIVLAMVFSATPLPFSDVTTPTFLFWWWSSVGLAYLAVSDYFHIVRAAAYLSLHRAITQNS